VAEYFDYYNPNRRHSSIGYLKAYLFHQQQLASIARLSCMIALPFGEVAGKGNEDTIIL
jgi:hypothetical protein